MNNQIAKRVAALLSVKSIVTIILTLIFAFLAITNNISQEFILIYTVIISFYFGTQSQKVQDAIADDSEVTADAN